MTNERLEEIKSNVNDLQIDQAIGSSAVVYFDELIAEVEYWRPRITMLQEAHTKDCEYIKDLQEEVGRLKKLSIKPC